MVSPTAAVLVSPTPALELNAPGCTPAGTSPASGPSVSCTPTVGGASTLAELDGITVTKPLGRGLHLLAFDWASLTPYMFSQGAADVPCTLLHFMGGELVNVSKGRIIQPGNPVFHGNPMPPTVYRVQLVRVLPGCDKLLPPIQPAGADKDDLMTLSTCLS